MRMRYFIILVLFLAQGILAGGILTAPANALEVINGKAIQGGMIILKSAPDSTLTANGEALMLSPQGYAVIGFHRDETAPITIIETIEDGTSADFTFTPAPRQYKEQRIDGLPPAMVTPPEETLARIRRDREIVSTARSFATSINAFSSDFIWPVHGTITGVYGSYRVLNGEPRAPHYGIDVAAPKGTPVRAPADGIIRMVDNLYFTGITIILDHGHGLSSTFLHLDKAEVKIGDRVTQNQMLGTVGSSGRSTGPHLDWRINLFERRLDPMLIAGQMPQ